MRLFSSAAVGMTARDMGPSGGMLLSGLRAVDADALSRDEAEAELAALAEEIGAHDLLYYQAIRGVFPVFAVLQCVPLSVCFVCVESSNEFSHLAARMDGPA